MLDLENLKYKDPCPQTIRIEVRTPEFCQPDCPYLEIEAGRVKYTNEECFFCKNQNLCINAGKYALRKAKEVEQE